MSPQLISHSPDLQRLRDEGFDIEARSGILLVKDVPYVNALGEVRRGTLASQLNLAGDRTAAPLDHVAYFIGEYPCDKDGVRLEKIVNSEGAFPLIPDVSASVMFSSKPPSGRYVDDYEKVTTYVAILSSQAEAIDPDATAKTFAPAVPEQDESVFNYADTATTRAGIVAAAAKLAGHKVAIVGVGGTGSYVLDLLAKCPVAEIHLIDGDAFLSHNAFRAPGAPSVETLREKMPKVAYLRREYSRMHRGIVAHETYLDEASVGLLQGMDFVFLCLDRGGDKRLAVERMDAWGTPFVDVGMGVNLSEDSLFGTVRVTASTAEKRNHVAGRIPFAEGAGDNEYARNIQIADLNALNAALAVIRWKKLCGFYVDYEREHFTAYNTDTNSIINEDLP